MKRGGAEVTEGGGERLKVGDTLGIKYNQTPKYPSIIRVYSRSFAI